MQPRLFTRTQTIVSRRHMSRVRVLSAGFTLIEMFIVLVIVAILVTLSAPLFRQTILNQGIRSASFDLYSALVFARSEAIKRNANVTIKAGPTSSTSSWTTGWRVEDGASNALRSWTAASGLVVAEKVGGTILFTYSKDGRISGPAKLEIKSSTTYGGVNPVCIQVDLIGRAWSKTGVCP